MALVCAVPASGLAQAGRGGQSNPAQVELMGCVAGGNLQPVEQPFVLEPAEPFELIDVVQRDSSLLLVAVSNRYEITGIDMTPWLGMRVKVEGVLADPAKTGQGAGAKAQPRIQAARVTSIWGTCPSRAAWTPVPPK
jgi:hypothetical protein